MMSPGKPKVSKRYWIDLKGKKMNYSISHAKEDMSKISLEEPLRDRMLKVAAIITNYMEEKVTHTSDLPIIVGGLAMEVYTSSKYVTRDIDLVSTASIKFAYGAAKLP